MTDFALHIGANAYSGWTSLQVTRSLEQLAHAFSVSFTDRWADQEKAVPIKAGDACVIKYGSQQISTGYVDEDELIYDAASRALSFAGRSKTADLVDCSAVYKTGKWHNKTLLDIAKAVCEPFDISVKANADVGEKFGAPDQFSINDGETAFECLTRGARQRGLLLLTDSDGNLVLDRCGSVTLAGVTVERGKNVLRGSKRTSWQDRFSSYTIKAQTAASDNLFGSSCTIKRSATDSGVTRYRPLVIIGDSETNGRELEKRAAWERNVRAGRSRRLTYTVQGWEYADGKLWEPNKLVRVIDADAEVDDTLLIIETTQLRDESGTTTALVLTAKEAFDVEPLPTKKKKGGLFP